MAKSKKRRKVLIWSIIGLVLAGLTVAAVCRKREAIVTVQTEKVGRRNLVEVVMANGKIQPVTQVKISPEVSGEIIDLPVKEGQCVGRGDLIVKIKPDFYQAQLHQQEASYEASVAGKATAEATLRKAEAEYKRVQDLFRNKLVSNSQFDEVKASYDVAQAQLESAVHQVAMVKALVDSAKESLDKTTIRSPLAGTISKLNSQLGERVLGTVQNMGTEIMTIADLNEMEARVDIGETDVVLIKPGQNVRLEVDAFKNRKFAGTVTEIANSSKTAQFSGSSSQEATKFEVKIRVNEKEAFRPGMSVTAEIETRYRTNVLAVPIASVTTRLPKEPDKKDLKAEKKDPKKGGLAKASGTTNSVSPNTNGASDTVASADPPTNSAAADNTNSVTAGKKSKEAAKPVEVVFLVNGERAKMVPVKIGISDDTHWEVTEGLQEGQEIVSGGYRAISRDLEDGKRIVKGSVAGEEEKDKKKE